MNATITLEITRAVVIQDAGSDKVMLTTNLPSACWPYQKEPLMMSFEAAANTGVEYLKRHFPGVPCEVLTRAK